MIATPNPISSELAGSACVVFATTSPPYSTCTPCACRRAGTFKLIERGRVQRVGAYVVAHLGVHVLGPATSLRARVERVGDGDDVFARAQLLDGRRHGRGRPASSSVPVRAWNTTLAVEPDCWGNRASSRSKACWDSVPGISKVSLVSPPAAWPKTARRTAVSTNAPTTHLPRRDAPRTDPISILAIPRA